MNRVGLYGLRRSVEATLCSWHGLCRFFRPRRRCGSAAAAEQVPGKLALIPQCHEDVVEPAVKGQHLATLDSCRRLRGALNGSQVTREIPA